MIVEKINIPKLILDNDAAYINHVEFVVKSIDENCKLSIRKRLDSLAFQVTPSTPSLKPFLIKGIRKSHYKLGLKIDFSKSVNATDLISFWTCFNET
jgi:hypothetical protein